MTNKNSSNDIINELISKYGFLLSLVNKNKTDNIQNDLYRVRIVDKNEEINEPEQLGYRKLGAMSGRCNFANESIFYCSDKSTTAIAEILKYQNPSNKYLYLSVWKLKPGNDINIFPFIEKAKQKALIKEMDICAIITDQEKKSQAEKQLLDIEKYFYSTDHSKSASICHILFKSKVLPCDCIFYPSIIKKETGINISFKTEYVDKFLTFQRAYKFELFGKTGDYKTELLNYTLSKNEFKWQKPNFQELIFRTLVKKDLGL